jgi:hypothetical protein
MAGPQIEGWFRLADQDADGAVGGAEAVRFFTRSGLPQDVLGQVSAYGLDGSMCKLVTPTALGLSAAGDVV